MSKTVILGSGGWGIAFAVMTDRFEHNVTLWTPFEAELNMLLTYREHKNLMPGVKLPDSVKITDDISCVSDAEAVVIAVPSSAVRETAERLKGIVNPDAVIVNLSKGLEYDTLMMMSEVIGSVLPGNELCIVSGPSHAEEVSRFLPTVVVAASQRHATAEKVQSMFSNEVFRIYSSDDVTGVEVAGAVKNVMAIAAGVLDGLGFEDNTKAALMTRGISEMARLGCAMGGKQSTFLGLAGIGDLIVTCTSMHSRNRRAGILLGQGYSLSDTLGKIGMTVEGIKTTHAAYFLAEKMGIEMPILNEVYNVIYNGKAPRAAIDELMLRPMRREL